MADRLTIATESWRPQRREAWIDPQIRRMALIAGGAVVVVALGVGGYSMLAHRPHGVPVIEADSRPLRVKPDNPGGMQVVGAEEQIMGGSGTQADAMAPAPEAPEPQVLRAQIQAARQPPPAPPVALAAPPVVVPPAVSAAPDQRPIAPAVVARAPAGRAPPSPTSAGMEVQLAALASEQAAMTEWQQLAKRMPDLMASRHPTVLKAERDGKTFYRLRTGGFADTAQATAFCTQIKAKGGGCAIASF